MTVSETHTTGSTCNVNKCGWRYSIESAAALNACKSASTCVVQQAAGQHVKKLCIGSRGQQLSKIKARLATLAKFQEEHGICESATIQL